MKPKILLVNPPIYDFTAYDFWLRPLGMLSVAGQLRHRADMTLLDFLDRLHPAVSDLPNVKDTSFHRGHFPEEIIEKPKIFRSIPRHYRRFGLPRNIFQQFLRQSDPFDFALVQTVMTYWYPGYREVIEDIRRFSPTTKIVLGGFYATVCPGHARSLGPDSIITDPEKLWPILGITPEHDQPPLWEAYPKLCIGAIKLSHGCPCRCTYCSVPQLTPNFISRPVEQTTADLDLLIQCGATDIAFYDDALLHKFESCLGPFLDHVMQNNIQVNFHTPNGLHARLITSEIARRMHTAGVRTWFLGYESSSQDWQKQTGSKVFAEDLQRAVECLTQVGVSPNDITAYELLGHPHSNLAQLAESLHFAHSLGIRVMLSDFSPIPGTPDGETCRRFVDLDEPLTHNKTFFPVHLHGADPVNRLKDLCRKLNRNL